MKRLLLSVILLVCLAGSPIFAESQVIFSEFSTFTESLAESFAGSLPFNSAIGLNWNTAYIGNFPHLAAGGTVGFTTAPIGGVKEFAKSVFKLQDLGPLENFKIGLPLLAYCADARIGGFGIPFDIGIKFGTIPDEVQLGTLKIKYILAGFDFRYALLPGDFLLPSISIGAGFNYLDAGISVPGVLGENITIADFAIPGAETVSLSLRDPAFAVHWGTSVIDFKVQISKDLLVIAPSAGFGLSYGISTAGGGISSAVLVNNTPITEDQKKIYQEAFKKAGLPFPDLQEGLILKKEVSGWSFRLFGGLSLNVLLLRLDIGAIYNINTENLGFTLNARVQL